MKLLTNKCLKTFLILFTSMLGIEVIFRLVSGIAVFDVAIIRIIIGIALVASLITLIFSFFNDKVRNICTVIFILASSIYALAQAAFNNYIGMYVSFSIAGQAGAVGDFVLDFFASIKWQYYLLLLPVIIVIILFIIFEKRINTYESNLEVDALKNIKGKNKKQEYIDEQNKIKKKKLLINRLIFLGVLIITSILYYISLSIGFMQNDLQMIDNKSLFKNPTMPNIAISQFGVEGFAVLDVKSLIISNSDGVVEFDNHIAQEVEQDLRREFDDSAWIALNESEKVPDYVTLNNYFMSKEITPKNEYTGLFEGKNLIVIMIESGSNVLLDYPEYFPNMAKLYNEGWSWENAFSPKNACSTGNNEMTGMTSLHSINLNCTANIYKDNTYFEAIFNLFNEKNYVTSSYHDYDEHFYYRKTYQPNMGSMAYYNIDDLKVTRLGDLSYQPWPSDVEFIEKSAPYYINEDNFMAWLTTVSSHMKYNFSSVTGDMYLDLFKNEKWNIQAKRYMSKLKIFDLAVGELLDELEAAGKLDDTVIMMYADHQPYGLDDEIFQEIAKYDVLNKYGDIDRTPFIIYNTELTPAKYYEYTSYINILPTLANLFNLDYDPRLYGGYDLLSDNYLNVVAFADGSWRNDVAYFDATNSSIYYLGDETYTPEEIKYFNNKIKLEMEMDNLAIKRDYFTYLNEKLNKGFTPIKNKN